MSKPPEHLHLIALLARLQAKDRQKQEESPATTLEPNIPAPKKIPKPRTGVGSRLVLSLPNLRCPIADIDASFDEIYAAEPVCPFHKLVHQPRKPPTILKEVALVIVNDTHQLSKGTEELLRDIGGGDVIRQMCTRFYALVMEDKHLGTFLFDQDGAASHGKRLGDWVVQKMGGEGEPWTEGGRWNMREFAHYRAWHNPDRPRPVKGKKFKLDDCRVWMRLMFWAGRQMGLHEHEAFFRWWLLFVKHFIKFYEATAPPYVHEDAAWSLDAERVREYEEGDRIMLDVVQRPHIYLSSS